MQSINPATKQIIKEYKTHDFVSVQSYLQDLQSSYTIWKDLPLESRINVIKNVAHDLTANKLKYAAMMTVEMGKVHKQAIQEVEKCALMCRYYIDNAPQFLAPMPVKTEASRSYVAYLPLGVILGIMPWNFPFWQVIRFAVPTLLAGNVAMLKHASCVPGCALLLETLFNTAAEDLNLQIFKTVLVEGKDVNPIIKHPAVQAVSLTGSVAAGKSVASIAGGEIKKTVLELGGSDPYIVLADANVKEAAQICTTARLNNCGQSCIAAKRFIVVEEVYHEFVEHLLYNFKQLKIGDPMQDDTNIGPLANKQVFDTLNDQVRKSIAAGAKCLIGGAPVNDAGYFFQPTILTDIPSDAPAATEEIFGPVASIFKVKDTQAAIDLANNTTFGLGAAIFTSNTNKGLEIAEKQLNAGNVAVNTLVASDPRLPFGGIKQSGYGRELSPFGIHEFVNIKAIKLS